MNTSLNAGDNATNAIAGNGNVQIYNQISPENLTDNGMMPKDNLTVTERDFAQIERLTRAVEDLTKASYELRIELQRTRSELREEFRKEVEQIRSQVNMPKSQVLTREQINNILTAVLVLAGLFVAFVYLSTQR